MPQPFDVRSLDWSRHHLSDEETEVGDGLFLPQAVQMIGKALLERGTGQETSLICESPSALGDLPDPDFAFDVDGTPIPEVHEAFGPMVRRQLSPALWASLQLERKDPAAWARSHVLDPETGSAITEGMLRSRQGDDADDPITYDHWHAVHIEARIDEVRIRWAPGALSIVAKAVGDMASAECRSCRKAVEHSARHTPPA